MYFRVMVKCWGVLGNNYIIKMGFRLKLLTTRVRGFPKSPTPLIHPLIEIAVNAKSRSQRGALPLGIVSLKPCVDSDALEALDQVFSMSLQFSYRLGRALTWFFSTITKCHARLTPFLSFCARMTHCPSLFLIYLAWGRQDRGTSRRHNAFWTVSFVMLCLSIIL